MQSFLILRSAGDNKKEASEEDINHQGNPGNQERCHSHGGASAQLEDEDKIGQDTEELGHKHQLGVLLVFTEIVCQEEHAEYNHDLLGVHPHEKVEVLCGGSKDVHINKPDHFPYKSGKKQLFHLLQYILTNLISKAILNI